MSYFQSSEHFINYLKKAVRDSGENVDHLPWIFYVDYIYKAGKAEDFSWRVKERGVIALQEREVWAWLKSFGKDRDKNFKHEITNELTDALDNLRGLPGVYSFWSKEGTALYVGRSINLCSRICDSFKRFKSYNRPVYVRYIVTTTASDAILLESYFIAMLTPPMNSADNYGDEVTLSIGPIPEWSDPVLCNWVIE
jgi:hypothetical protein